MHDFNIIHPRVTLPRPVEHTNPPIFMATSVFQKELLNLDPKKNIFTFDVEY